MNISEYIQGFKSYLELEGLKTNKDYNLSGVTDSIFAYSDEFKNYISEKTGLSISSSIKINELLEMEIKNGQLIDPNDDNKVYSSGKETTDNVLPQEDDTVSTSEDSKTSDADSASDEEDAETENVDNSETKALEQNPKTQQKTSILDFLNFFISDDKTKEIVDADGDGGLNKDEIQSFLDRIRGFDNDLDSISLEDILSAGKAIENNTFGLTETENPSSDQSNNISESDSQEDINEEDSAETIDSDSEEEINTDEGADDDEDKTTKSSGSTSSSSGVRGSGGGGSFSQGGISSDTTPSGSEEAVDLTSMNTSDMTLDQLNEYKTSYVLPAIDEINSAIQTQEGETNKTKENFDKVKEASKQQVENAQGDFDKEDENYKKAIEEDNNLTKEEKEKLTDFLNQVTQAEKSQTEAMTSLADAISLRTSAYEKYGACQKNVMNTQSSITELEGKISGLESALASYSNVSSDDKETSDKKAKLEVELKKAKNEKKEQQQELKKAENALQTGEKELNNAKQKVEDCEEAYNNAAKTLEDLNKRREDKEDEINKLELKLDNKTRQAKENYNNSKQTLDKTKEEQKTNIDESQETLYQAQKTLEENKAALVEATAELDKVNAEINKKEAEEKYRNSSFGDKMLENASKYLGMSEKQIESLTGMSFSNGLWCADFVHAIINETFGNNAPDWYKNLGNKSLCSAVKAAAGSNVYKDSSQAKAGDLIIFNTSRGKEHHIGIVEKVENGVVYTIEGNSSNGECKRRSYRVTNTGRINCYIKMS